MIHFEDLRSALNFRLEVEMRNVMICFLSVAVITLLSGCLATADNTANEAGKVVGKVLSIPSSASQGVADGIADEEKKPNPYNR